MRPQQPVNPRTALVAWLSSRWRYPIEFDAIEGVQAKQLTFDGIRLDELEAWVAEQRSAWSLPTLSPACIAKLPSMSLSAVAELVTLDESDTPAAACVVCGDPSSRIIHGKPCCEKHVVEGPIHPMTAPRK